MAGFALREQFEEYRAPGHCTLTAGGKAFYNINDLNAAMAHAIELGAH